MVVIRNILAILIGLPLASAVNMGLITLGHSIIALPPGADVSSYEALKASMPLFGPEQFVFPFLAHAIGTLVGAAVAALIAASHKFKFAMAIGVIFLIGGIVNVILLPAPLWYDVIDVIFAYIPMAWIGAKLAGAGREVN